LQYVCTQAGASGSTTPAWPLQIGATVIDGSVFPTSIGANPQLSVYALALRAADALRQRMGA
jgi:hypothetical protein